MIASPLNYTGGKYRLLPQLLPLLPSSVETFVDLFCGGCNVGLNVQAAKTVYNDIDQNLPALYHTFKHLEKDIVFQWICEIIEEYGLSRVDLNGYGYYHCSSRQGLSGFNRPHFLKLRNELNRRKRSGQFDHYYYMLFYVTIVYAFNNQIRYNRRGEYNIPVGKRDFNASIQRKLSQFIDRIQEQNCQFTSLDFREFDVGRLTPADLVYADPPYLITCATYNEQGRWTEREERELLALLDRLHRQRVRFALSNVLRSKGKENTILLQWLAKNEGQYHAIPLSFNYSNSSYQTQDRTSGSEEVLITNYPTSSS